MFAIPNCDTVKKARTFLEKNKIEYTFIDLKKSRPTNALIQTWSNYLGELPVNRKGTTYRKYKEHFDELDRLGKIEFLIANPSIIKRPVLMNKDQVIALGFDEQHYQEQLKDWF